MSTHPRCARGPAPRERSRARRTRWASRAEVGFPAYRLGAVALAFLVALLPLWLGPPALDAPDAGVSVLASPPESPAVLADAADLGREAVAYLPLPDNAPAWQQTQCDPKRGEVRLSNGGCYKEQASKPPCMEGEYLHDGKCWAAVAKRERPRTTVSEDAP